MTIQNLGVERAHNKLSTKLVGRGISSGLLILNVLA